MKASERNGPAMLHGNLRLLLFTALAVAFAGCSTFNKDPGPPPEPNVLPTNYRAHLLDFLQVQLTDPIGVREAFISEPRLQPVGTETRYVICVRYNSKDGYGRYTGVRDYVGIYFHGSLTQFIPAAPQQCAGAAYVPFPELERLKRPSG